MKVQQTFPSTTKQLIKRSLQSRNYFRVPKTKTNSIAFTSEIYGVNLNFIKRLRKQRRKTQKILNDHQIRQSRHLLPVMMGQQIESMLTTDVVQDFSKKYKKI